MDALLVTESIDEAKKFLIGTWGLGLNTVAVDTLDQASFELDFKRPRAVIIDLKWSLRKARLLSAWLLLNVVRRGIPVVLTCRTPLALDLDSAFALKEATILHDGYGIADVAEALGVATMSRADAA